MTIKIIAGKRYNTETADKVAEWHNDLPRNDIHHCAENLYHTPKGSWFLDGDGGAASKYATEAYGGGWTGQTDVITPLSPGEALAWLEERGETEIIEQYFSDNVEDA
jgi:hypothetical protein